MSPIETWLSLTGTKSTLLQTFRFQVARLQVYVAITCYTLLHQATRAEGKNSLRGGVGIFSFWSWSSTIFLYFTTLTLIYDVLFSFRLYYIEFKEVKILWGPDVRTRCWGPDNPNTRFGRKKKFNFVNRIIESHSRPIKAK